MVALKLVFELKELYGLVLGLVISTFGSGKLAEYTIMVSSLA